MKRRGSTLFEVLMAIVILAVVVAVFLPTMLGTWRMQTLSFGMPTVENDARAMALRIADALRAATLCTASDSGCTLDAAAENATTTGVTAYRRNDDGSLKRETLSVVGGTFQEQFDGAAATTINTDATLTLVYFTGATYNSTSLTSFAPTNATLKTLAAVGIKTSVQRNGLTSSYSTIVRLRNSPKP